VSLLEVSDLRTAIHLHSGTVKAVDGVSFSVDAGQTVGVVGESGCGKTMVGLSIMRLLPEGGRVTGGTILFDGKDLTKLSDEAMHHVRGKDIGMVFQDPMTSLNPTMEIGHQVSESVRLHRGATREEGLGRAEELLNLVGMPRPKERLKDYPHQLSGGLRQRVMIAMALACDPKLIIADEPTTALDVTIQAQILTLLDDLRERLGLAMILITHDLGVIAGRADRVLVMYAGRIIEAADTVELFRHTRHPYTESLLASIPRLDQDPRLRLRSIPGLPPDLMDPPAGCRFAARCPYAQPRCRLEDPRLEGPDPDHTWACFFPRPDPEGWERAGASITAGAAGGNGATPHGDGQSPLDFILEVRNVSKEFPVRSGLILQRTVGTLKALTDVSIDIHRGETFGLVGESGCGKTTLGKLVVALEKPTAGQVIFNGVDLASMSSKALRKEHRNLQIMFQDPYASLDPRMRVGGIVGEPLLIQHQGDARARRSRVAELLDEVGLEGKMADRYPHEFSGGQRQRIGLARALALRPDLIVADEPVSALDVSIRSQILNLMKDLQGRHQLTYIVISHDLSVVRYLADRIGVMYLGKLVEVGTGQDIYLRPAHPYTAGLLKAIPLPNPSHERTKEGVAVRGELPSPVHPPSGCRFRTRCPLAQERCAEEVPLLGNRGGEHYAACHFPLN
jgi:peptide/nickel transport system ATP-binding protein